MPLVSAVYDTLVERGAVDGISLLCCGKILSYEADGAELMKSFQLQLCDHLADTGIKRIVAACPNCVKALREGLALDERCAGVEVAVLPRVMAHLGIASIAMRRLYWVKGDASAPLVPCTHDSCPDRGEGEFADGLRAMLPEGLVRRPCSTAGGARCAAARLRVLRVSSRRPIRSRGATARRRSRVGADAIVTRA